MRWTRAAPETRALPRTAKSCRSDAPRPASSLREEAQATVPTKPGHRGDHEISRKTIARGMPGETGVTVATMLVCLFYFAREAAGALGIRHSLRPLFSGRIVHAPLGRIAPRECGRALSSLFEIESNNKHARRPGLEPGPITTGRDVARGWSGSPFKNAQRWLWVPAFQAVQKPSCGDVAGWWRLIRGRDGTHYWTVAVSGDAVP